MISYSNDQGRPWSVPKPIEPSASGRAFLGSIAVSLEGVLVALWIKHERYEPNPKDYRVWFAASLDGGETFTASTPSPAPSDFDVAVFLRDMRDNRIDRALSDYRVHNTHPL